MSEYTGPERRRRPRSGPEYERYPSFATAIYDHWVENTSLPVYDDGSDEVDVLRREVRRQREELRRRQIEENLGHLARFAHDPRIDPVVRVGILNDAEAMHRDAAEWLASREVEGAA